MSIVNCKITVKMYHGELLYGYISGHALGGTNNYKLTSYFMCQ